MKLIVFVACLVVALGATNGQTWEGSMGMKRPAGMMVGRGGSMSSRGMEAGGMAGGMMASSESGEMKSQEMPSAFQGGLGRGGKMESGMMRGSTMMRASDMESKKMGMSAMGMRSDMRPMGMERRGEERSTMTMRKESMTMSSKKPMMGSERMMPKTEPRMEMMMPKKGMMMDTMGAENMEKVRMMKKEERRADGILDESMESNPEGYMYKYKTDDGVDVFQQGRMSQGRSAEDSSMKVDGMYTWTAPNGYVYKVEYTADETGFHPRMISRA